MLPYSQASLMQGQVEGNPVWHNPVAHPPMGPAPPYRPVMDRVPAEYKGFNLKPLELPEGQYSWDHVTDWPINESDAKLAELARKDMAGNKVDEVMTSQYLNDTRRRQVYRVLESCIASEVNSGMTFKLDSVKPTKETRTTKNKDSIVKKTYITSIRVIMKRVRSSVSGLYPGQALPFPAAGVQVPGQQAVLAFGHPHIPQNQAPIVHQDFGNHGHPGIPVREEMHSPTPSHEYPGMFRMDSPPEVPEEYLEEDMPHHQYQHRYEHQSHTKHGKKNKDKDRNEPVNIRSHERHNSKHSSRPTSWDNSDGASLFESPLTSVSNSPQTGIHDSKHRSRKHYPVYPGQGSNGSYRNRSKDDFVMEPSSNRHRPRRSMNSDDNHRPGPSKYHSREPDYRDDLALTSTLESLRLDEYNRRVQEQQQLQRHIELDNRLNTVETLLLHKPREEVIQDRPRFNRRYSDTYDIGYSSVPARRRHGDRPGRYM